MNIVSFYVPRPLEHPVTPDYIAMLVQVQRSCDLLGLRHVVLTDPAGRENLAARKESYGIETFVRVLPDRLMRACTLSHALWMREGDWKEADTLLVGADCLILRDPRQVFPRAVNGPVDIAFTLRPGHARYPINCGAMWCPIASRKLHTGLYDRIAERCGPKWGDDQRAVASMLDPMPDRHGVFTRYGMQVAFLPMDVHNDWPRGMDDDGRDSCVLHFRGKGAKPLMLPWAAKWLGHRERLARKARKHLVGA